VFLGCTIELSFHCFVDMPILYLYLVEPFHLTDTNFCEVFFSRIGSTIGMKRVYDSQEFLGTANTVNHLSQIEYKENKIKFARTHNKMNNI